MKKAGALVVVLSPPEVQLNGFTSLLNIDMKHDLPKYLESTVKNRDAVKITSIADAVVFNDSDSLLRIPYGQAIFKDILADPMSDTELEILKDDLEKSGRSFFNDGLETYQLDAILSINNYHAGFAAVAKYPALTVPMGFRDSGEPVNLTFISQPFCEDQLYPLGMAFESLTVARKAPPGYP
jgi:amidase